MPPSLATVRVCRIIIQRGIAQRKNGERKMDHSLAQVLAIVGLVVGVVLIVEWIFLPFAVFGIKSKLGALVFEAERTNRAIATLTAELQAARADFRQPPNEQRAKEKPPMA